MSQITLTLMDKKLIEESTYFDITNMNFPENIMNRSNMKGFVEVYEKQADHDLKLREKQNMIVYEGREIFLQRLLAKDRIMGSNEKDLFISWVSIGTGGALPADMMTPISPIVSDTTLDTEVIIDSTNSNYCDSGRKKPFDGIEFMQDDTNSNKYLIAKITTTILRSDANVYNINEAGLWLSNSTSPISASTFKLFSRCTFSTLRKDSSRELILVWYLFI